MTVGGNHHVHSVEQFLGVDSMGTQANCALRLPLSRKTYFAQRAQDGDLDQALKLLGRAGGVPPAAGDAAV